MKIYAADSKKKNEKNEGNDSLNLSKKLEDLSNNKKKTQEIQRKDSPKKNPQIKSFQILKLKEKTQKDIKMIEKQISQELLVLNNTLLKTESKNKNNKAKSCNQQEILDYKTSNKVKKHEKN